MKMQVLVIVFLIFCSPSFAQPPRDTIQLHFLYGSKPAKEYKETESRHFGGIKGGHVNIEANGRILDFLPGNCPILPENNKPTGGFRLNPSIYWDTASTKWATIKIPVTEQQLSKLDSLFTVYAAATPYDYAVFGMRCAAASYDVLSEIGLFKKLPDKNNIIKNFYPKLLRKRVLKWAAEKNYPVIFHSGKPSRKWESDEGIL